MIPIDAVMRVVRPTDNLEQITKMYADGLGFKIIGGFDGHSGFSGRMLGHPKHHYHLEFTTDCKEKASWAPTIENLLVYYVPDNVEFAAANAKICKSDFKKVSSFNPYWDGGTQTFEDVAGYRVVINNAGSLF